MIKTSRNKKVFLTSCVALLVVSTGSYALPFSITPTAGTALPTEVMLGQTVTALYTVTNNTSSVRAGNSVTYLPPNVTQVTSDAGFPDLCSAYFTLNPQGTSGSSCTLELRVSGAVNAGDANAHNHLFVCFPGGVACAGTTNPLNVTIATPTLPTQAYISNFGTNTVTLCAIDVGTGKFVGCKDSGAGAVFNTPAQLAFNNLLTPSFAYIANFGGSVGTTVSLCRINSTTSALSECANADGDGTAIFSGPLGMTVNHTGTFAYIGNINSNTVSSCAINSSTGKLSSCIANTGDAYPFIAPIGIAFNNAGTRAYVANTALGTVALCSVNLNTGALNNCINAAGDSSAVFNGPALISFNTAGTRLYVSDNAFGTGNSLTFCSVNLVTGKLYNCEDSGVGPLFESPVSVTFNASNTRVYVSNNGGGSTGTTVSLCSVNSSTGKLTACVNSDGDGSAVFSAPAGVTLK